LVGFSAVEEKMTEEYKFVGFSSDVALFAEVDRYCVRLLEELLADLPDRHQWSIIEEMSDGGYGKDELVRRRFAASPDTVSVGCHSSATRKGVRVQIHDPAGEDGVKLCRDFGVTLTERPAIVNAFMDTFDDPGRPRFSRNLVITCELTSRTEELAKDLIRLYIRDGLSYESMATRAQALSDREGEMWTKWKAEHNR
jgi:hypothetical protein